MAETSRTRRRFDLSEGMAILERTPGVVDAMLRNLPGGWIQAHEGGETWSPYDVVGHLIHGERTDWMARVRRLMEHGELVRFDAFDRFAQLEGSKPRTLDQLLDDFARLRAENLRQLKDLNLTPADFDRRGTHPVFGPVTLRQLLATWVAHDLDHVTQIARVIARQYSDEVGPWRAYLRVISGEQG